MSLVLDVTKIATIRHNYSSASRILRFWKHVDLDVHLVGYLEKKEKKSRRKKQIYQCLNSVDSAVSGKVCGVQLGLCTEME